MQTSERAIRFDFGPSLDLSTLQIIQQFCSFIKSNSNLLLEEVVPSNQTITVFYQKELANPVETIEKILTEWANRTNDELILKTRMIEIPVCYDESFSDDMVRVMEYTKLSREEIIALHTNTSYTVYMIGFLPGFPYLGNLPDALHVPRLNKPRLRVAKGTVGIGGMQTGIYPIDSPGGWNIIGRTPLDLYSLKRLKPFFVRAGDRLSFRAISLEVFHELKDHLAQEPEIIKQFVRE